MPAAQTEAPPTTTPDADTAQPVQTSTLPMRDKRVLACVLCQQRKIKCDRNFPCQHCIKARVQCVPAGQLPRRRKRRFAEKELLEQLRRYEDLLKKNGIQYEPLSKDGGTPAAGDDVGPEDGGSKNGRRVPKDGEGPLKFREMWHVMRRDVYDSSDYDEEDRGDISQVLIKRAWDQANPNDNHLLFGCSPLFTMQDLFALHPSPAHIFRLWQIFLDNVNPLLHVVHAPTLQPRIIEAIGNLKECGGMLTSLLFGIYSCAVLSLTEDECRAAFGGGKEELLLKWQFACQQALLNSGFLRSSERECLCAFFLYLVSVATSTDPRSLCSMLGLAVRIAQRMKIDTEASLLKLSILEAEMSRRLWWALVLLDLRIGQLADWKSEVLFGSWDAKAPMNVNDMDLRPGMKEPPRESDYPSEAIFAVVKTELCDRARALNVSDSDKGGSNSVSSNDDEFGAAIERKYLANLDLSNPLHNFTLWLARATMAKVKLLSSYNSKLFEPSQEKQSPHGDEQAVDFSLMLLTADTNCLKEEKMRRYRWYTQLYFPFPAYIHLAKAIKAQPAAEWQQKVWDCMSKNFAARYTTTFEGKDVFLRMFTKLMLSTWEVCADPLKQQAGANMPEPSIVAFLKEAAANKPAVGSQASHASPQDTLHQQPTPESDIQSYGAAMAMPVFPYPMPTMQFTGYGDAGIMSNQEITAATGNIDINANTTGSTDWSGMDWGMY
ncbi:hypothetical protein BDV96DRAFT_506910 [Lophiotrema nucula]|uniref:Zn(2)-C6 fungal-type domain-containing protein n=1 Tax=Lophiotrema nucula TaxID=690887 RepID=A0A6A5YLF2_9PLEO|nr:hypothetical protein BDV96DRAFT_506910 [Lophiotrema nucula]